MSAAPVRTRRLPDPAPGCRAYLVLVEGAPGTPEGILGTVTNRRGGWWRATSDRGEPCGSFHSTRRSGIEALVRASS